MPGRVLSPELDQLITAMAGFRFIGTLIGAAMRATLLDDFGEESRRGIAG